MTRGLPAELAAELDLLGLGGGFIPPPGVAQAARHGLALRMQHKRGGTGVGLARAQALVACRPHSAREMRVIAAWFARFSYLRGRGRWDDARDPSTGYIAWLLWGGDEGRAWVERHRADWS